MKIHKNQIIPGTRVIVRKDGPYHGTPYFLLDAPTFLAGNSIEIFRDQILVVRSKPKRIDGVHIVKVSLDGDDIEYNVFYMDFVYRCEIL